jgi:toxin ParE1/3/4
MPTRYAVSFTRSAEQDLEDIWSFISEDNVEQAIRFINKVKAQVASLERFPERRPLIAENELMRTRYRHFVLGKYRTIFRISQRTVYVLRIIHGSRLLDTSVFESPDID